MTLQELLEENKALKDKLSLGKSAKDYKEWLEQATPSLSHYIETMAAAFCKFTDLNPNDCVLHTGISQDGKKIVYWFSKKDKLLREDVKHTEEFNYI